jgi:WD40 repeat protein
VTELAATPLTSPFKGLAPFDDSDRDATLFFGREREREIIAANLMAYRLTVLYGVSGVGKSSVLRAGVVHHLRRTAEENRGRLGHPQLAIVAFDSWSGDPVAGLLSTTHRALVDLFGEERVAEPTGGLGDSLVVWSTELECELYLVLDQIDEYFLYHDKDEEFVSQFADAATREGLRVNFLLSIREDMLARLDRFKGRIPNLFSNYLRLDHLDREAARTAIIGPVGRYDEQVEPELQVSIEPALVEAVLDQTVAGRVRLDSEAAEERVERPGRVEAPYLQLVMQRLWDEERAPGSRTLRVSTLERLGGANEIVRAHLGAALAALTPGEQDLAETLFNYLVTPSGTKIAHGLGDLASYAAAPEGAILPVLSTLVQERIIRPITEGGDLRSRYEIYHDVLAEPVAAWRARHAAERQVALQRQTAERKHRRMLAITVLSLVAVAGMALVTVFALAQRREAQRQRTEARAGRREAIGSELVARSASLRSDYPRKALALAVQAAHYNPPGIDNALRASLIASPEAIMPVGGAGKGVIGVEFSRSGVGIAGSKSGRALTFTAGGKPLRRLDLGGPLTTAVISTDGNFAFTGGKRRGVVWATTSGSRVQNLHPPAAITAAQFRTGTHELFVATSDGHIRSWDAASGKRRLNLAVGTTIGEIRFDRLGAAFVAVGDDDGARVFTRTGVLLRTLHHHGLRTAAIGPNAKFVVTGGNDHLARLWRVSTGALVGDPRPHRGEVTDVAFSPAGTNFVTGSTDQSARIWSAARAGIGAIAQMPDQGSAVERVAYSRDGHYIVVASRDGNARIYKATNGLFLAKLAGHRDAVTDAAFGPGSSRVATTSLDGDVRIWDPQVGPSLRVVANPRLPVRGLAVSPKGDELLIATAATGRHPHRVGGPNRASIWTTSRKQLTRPIRLAGPTLAVAWTREPLVLAAGPRESTLNDLRTRRTLRLRNDPSAASGAISRDARWLATARGRVIHVWRRNDLSRRRTIESSDRITSLALSPDARFLAAGGAGGVSWIWDLRTGGMRVLSGHANAVTSIAFSLNGRWVVTGSRDTDVRVWNAASGAPVGAPLRKHGGTVSDAEFSPDGRWIVTAGPVTAGLWQFGHKEPVLLTRVQPRIVRVTVFAPRGERIFTGSDRGTVRSYTCDVCGRAQALRDLAEARLHSIGGG